MTQNHKSLKIYTRWIIEEVHRTHSHSKLSHIRMHVMFSLDKSVNIGFTQELFDSHKQTKKLLFVWCTIAALYLHCILNPDNSVDKDASSSCDLLLWSCSIRHRSVCLWCSADKQLAAG